MWNASHRDRRARVQNERVLQGTWNYCISHKTVEGGQYLNNQLAQYLKSLGMNPPRVGSCLLQMPSFTLPNPPSSCIAWNRKNATNGSSPRLQDSGEGRESARYLNLWAGFSRGDSKHLPLNCCAVLLAPSCRWSPAGREPALGQQPLCSTQADRKMKPQRARASGTWEGRQMLLFSKYCKILIWPLLCKIFRTHKT